MDRIAARRLERLAESFAAISFGGAVGWAVLRLLDPAVDQPALGAAAMAAGAIAFGGCRAGLARVQASVVREPLAPDQQPSGRDVSAVVALFGNERADGPARSEYRDASAELCDALDQLRRSLR